MISWLFLGYLNDIVHKTSSKMVKWLWVFCRRALGIDYFKVKETEKVPVMIVVGSSSVQTLFTPHKLETQVLSKADW